MVQSGGRWDLASLLLLGSGQQLKLFWPKQYRVVAIAASFRSCASSLLFSAGNILLECRQGQGSNRSGKRGVASGSGHRELGDERRGLRG